MYNMIFQIKKITNEDLTIYTISVFSLSEEGHSMEIWKRFWA